MINSISDHSSLVQPINVSSNSTTDAANMITYDLMQDNNDIAAFFGVMAQQKQKAMNTGRHPSSMPKNSELWNYTKLSTQRRNRIKKGHEFWDVINEENITSTLPSIENNEPKEKEDEYTIRSKEFNFLKGSSINQKLRNFLTNSNNNDIQHLELKIDFKNKNQIYYGMSFIIMNYNDEIIYVNNKDELRCKPINQIETSDRIKFKMIDLNNPSNPKSLNYGDNMYLQCLDSSENSDNSFTNGTVLTSKLFGLPSHSSLNFNLNHIYTTTDNTTHHHTSMHNKHDNFLYSDNDHSKQTEPNSPEEILPKSSQNMRKNSMINTQTMPNNVMQESKDELDDEHMPVDDYKISTPRRASTAGTTTTTSDALTQQQQQHAKAKQYSNAATICGDVHVTRICEMRQIESQLGFQADFGLLSDDKAMRYTSKSASLLGKWCVHTAELESSPTKDRQRRHGVGRSQSMHATKDQRNTASGDMMKAVKDNRVYSLSPIFIQQDLYCLSTKQASEHNTWPMRSTAIINRSTNISQDTAQEYRTAYRESAVVKNSLQQRQYNKGSSQLYEGDDYIDEDRKGWHNGDDNSSVGSSVTANTGAGTGGINTSSNNTNNAQPSYGCLRKVVKRGPPYDFSVDRRCVWKFCLFEQFSDNNIKLSVKDKATKKVMESATMAMKLSQLNREGAHTHIQNHTYGEDLPPLKSGESFVRTLREINFKTSLKLEDKYLKMRREKEKKLKQHFAHHMSELRQVEKLSIIEDEKKENKNNPEKKKEIGDDHSFLTSLNDDFSYSMDSVHSYNTNSTNNISTMHMSNSNTTTTTTSSTTTNKGKRVNILLPPKLTLSEDNDASNTPIITAMSPKARLLMTKPLQRTTSFLIDSVPSNLKSPKSESSKHIQNNSIHSGSNLSTPYSSPSHSNLNNVHLMSPSSRIKSYAKNIDFTYPTNTHTNPNHATTSTTTATSVTGTTTTPKHRNAVTFNFENSDQTEDFLTMDKSIISPYTAKLNNTANLVTQSLAALPDYHIKQKQKERNTHLNPKRLLLDNAKSMHLYDQLSDGEKVLALHKTFHHIGGLVNDPNRPRRYSGGTSNNSTTSSNNMSKATSINMKLNKLLEEDAHIKMVLHHKERREHIRSKDELYENSSGI